MASIMSYEIAAIGLPEVFKTKQSLSEGFLTVCGLAVIC